ncbi:flavin reductase family protein [uncultured Bosea sp.]|uniref:flavin reductase family protein n=1 Tax=uncultured Bosea sp. TaxID=211457 RepID=UPI0025D3368D|nr:flavin reductase family protein [uncultured Bosea sp.]
MSAAGETVRAQDSTGGGHAGAADFTALDLRAALGMFATGVTIVTAESGGERIGATVSSFNSVSLDPPLVLFSVGRNAKAFAAWNSVERFAINVLDQSQRDLSSRFGRAQGDKWLGVKTLRGEASGAALLPGALAWFECETHRILDGGDHIIILGRVLTLTRHGGEAAQPLVFFGGSYRNLDAKTRVEPLPSEHWWVYAW